MSATTAVRQKVVAGLALLLLTTGLLTMALASGGRIGPTESVFEVVWGETGQRYAFWYGLLATGGGLAVGRFVGTDREGDGPSETQFR